jgi:hypothetical protein
MHTNWEILMTDHGATIETVRIARFRAYGEPVDVLRMDTVAVTTLGL